MMHEFCMSATRQQPLPPPRITQGSQSVPAVWTPLPGKRWRHRRTPPTAVIGSASAWPSDCQSAAMQLAQVHESNCHLL